MKPAEQRQIALLNLKHLGIQDPSPKQIDMEIARMDKANRLPPTDDKYGRLAAKILLFLFLTTVAGDFVSPGTLAESIRSLLQRPRK